MSGDMDSEPLITEVTPKRCQSKLLCPALVCLGLGCLIGAIVCAFVTYQASLYDEGVPIRVLALNTWGMPAAVFGGVDKEIRMPAIAEMIKKKEYDVYLLEELWMRPDHETIREAASSVGLHMTSYDSLTQSGCPYLPIFDFWCCDGGATPSGCSGLAVVSKYPLQQVDFTIYNIHGPMSGGEKLARKGFGKIRIEPKENLTVDIFVTHTCASDLVEDKSTREAQVKQLLEAVRKSTADFSILGGDFNSDPRAINETTYGLLKNEMASSMEDFFQRLTDLLLRKKATYGNPRNSYSSSYDPVLYDYIWHRSNNENLVLTNFFDVPWLTTLKNTLHTNKTRVERSVTETSGGEITNLKAETPGGDNEKLSGEIVEPPGGVQISLSDHEAVTASIMLFKRKKDPPTP